MANSIPARLVCEECGRASDAAAVGWHGYLVEAGDDYCDARDWREVLFFCPQCVEREFQPQSARGPRH